MRITDDVTPEPKLRAFVSIFPYRQLTPVVVAMNLPKAC
jgi:hypothetical protein